MAQSTITIDFGTGKTDVSLDVADPTITGGQLVEAWIFPATTANNTAENHWVEDLKVIAGNVQAGVGFTIYAHYKTGLAHGVYSLGYVFN